MLTTKIHMQRCRPLLLFLLLLLLAGCQGKSIIVNSVVERDANEIVVLLSSKGINAQKIPAPVSTTGGAAQQIFWDITVPAIQITDALAVLNHAGLPRVKGTSLLSLFGTQGLVPSDLQDQIRYQEGLSEQLANTIRKMDGVLDADVQITFPKENAKDQTLTASVYIKHQGMLDNPNSLLITKIKRLVASAVPTLKIEEVSVVADRALYSDLSLPNSHNQAAKNQDFVSIWSIIIARESVALFRFVFYCLLILIFLLFCIAAWLLWKFYPLTRQLGWKKLFTTEQFSSDAPPLKDKTLPPPPSEDNY